MNEQQIEALGDDVMERAEACLQAIGSRHAKTLLAALGVAVTAVINALPEHDRDRIATEWLATLLSAIGMRVEWEPHGPMH